MVKHKLGTAIHKDFVDFAVWAPFARDVKLLLSGMSMDWKAHDMKRDPEGVWSTRIRDARPGQTYKYLITTDDGRELKRNDPRARQLTASEDGNSIIVDNSFDWGDDDFTPPPREKAVIYEMHIGTFARPDAATIGTFKTAIDKLDYLKELGVNMIELMPVTSMSMSFGWGYAPNHLFSVEENYGGRRGLMEFVRAAHSRGMGVILDVVYNHFFPEGDLFQFDGWSENGRGGIYFYNDARGDTPWGARPDYGRKEVRDFILDNVTMWLDEYRVDGLRLDSTIYMRNTNGANNDPTHDIAEAWSLLQDINRRAHRANPNVLMIAEDNSENAALTASISDGGAGFDDQWGLRFPYAIRRALGLIETPTLDILSEEMSSFYNSDPLAKIIFSDSHDTAANGATRLNETVTPGNAASVLARKQALLASAVIFTTPGIPMLLQGQEFTQDGAFTDWQALDWDKAEQFTELVTAHRDLINLRLDKFGVSKGLVDGELNIFHCDATNNVMAWMRGDVVVIANFGAGRFRKYDVVLPTRGTFRVRFNSSWRGYGADFAEAKFDVATTNDDGKITFPIADYSAVILSRES